jgi:hypothetical protein
MKESLCVFIHNSSDASLQEGEASLQKGVMGPKNKGTHPKRFIEPTYQVGLGRP